MAETRLLPNDQRAEEAVLGALLSNPGAIDVARELIEPEDMFADSHRIVLESVYKVDDAGDAVDVVSVATALQSAGRLQMAGGSGALAQLMDAPAVADVATHCRCIADKARIRRIINAAAIIQAEGFGDIECETWSQRSEQLIFEAAESERRSDHTELLGAILPRLHESMSARSEHGEAAEWEFVQAPWALTRSALTGRGFCLTKLYVIAGRPGMGKSLFCSDILRRGCVPGIGGLYVSLEMPKSDLAARMLAAESGVPLTTILSGEPSAEDWSQITAATERLSKKPIALRYAPGASVPLIRSVIRRESSRLARLGSPLRVVVVDYLQLVHGTRQRGDSREVEVSDISRNLCAMAGEFNVAMLEVSQLNRSLETRPNKRPQLSDLRESGAIEQDADTVMFLYRDEYYDEASAAKGKSEVIVAKQRNGPTGTHTLDFHGDICSFEDDEYHDFNAPTDNPDARYP
jgi:replicative DNA helicase